MKFIKHIFVATGIGFIIILVYMFYYTGAFKKVQVGEDTRGPYTLIYLDHTGPYQDIVKKIEAVETWTKEQGMTCRLSFGQYFDDPKTTELGRLKSRGGCMLDPQIPNEVEILKKAKLPDAVKTETLPPTKYAIALFTGAPSIGPLKVYPKIEEYIKAHSLKHTGSIIEIYEILGKKSMETTYLWPVN